MNAAIEEAIRTKGIFQLEHRVRLANGSIGWTFSRAVPLLDSEGEISEWFGAASDVSQRRHVEEQLRESESLRRVALTGGRMGTWRWDLNRRLVKGDAQFFSLWGFPPAEDSIPLEAFTARMSAEGAAEIEAVVNKAIELGEEFDGPIEIVSGPTAGHWVRWRGRALDQDTSVLYGVSFDITEQVRAEENREKASVLTENALAEKEELLKEVHHRVKNNLQVITSLLNLQADQIAEKETLAAFDEARNRVASIAFIHELLYRSTSLAGIDMAHYAREFAPHLLSFYGVRSRVEVIVSGDGVTLELERAVPYGLLLNEALSNSLKHAFPGERVGHIHVSLQVHGEMLHLRIADDGVGVPAGFEVDESASLGLRLIRRLARQLDGELKFEGGSGTVVEVVFPVSTSKGK